VSCELCVVGCGLWAVGSGLWAVGSGLGVVGCGLWAVVDRKITATLGGKNDRQRQENRRERNRFDSNSRVLVRQQYLNTTVLQKTRRKEGGKGIRASELMSQRACERESEQGSTMSMLSVLSSQLSALGSTAGP